MDYENGSNARPQARASLRVVPAESIKLVTKPWGWEKWIATGGPDFPYMFKIDPHSSSAPD